MKHCRHCKLRWLKLECYQDTNIPIRLVSLSCKLKITCMDSQWMKWFTSYDVNQNSNCDTFFYVNNFFRGAAEFAWGCGVVVSLRNVTFIVIIYVPRFFENLACFLPSFSLSILSIDHLSWCCSTGPFRLWIVHFVYSLNPIKLQNHVHLIYNQSRSITATKTKLMVLSNQPQMSCDARETTVATIQDCKWMEI